MRSVAMPDSVVENGKVVLRRDHDERKPLVQRLNRIEGQLRGIRLMIEEDRHCADELQQIKAAIAALREVGLAIFEQHATVAAELAATYDGEIADGRKVALADLMRVLREGTRL
jgi:CsoR family transcriptional regulator, copper-sensing transcriptional repressor